LVNVVKASLTGSIIGNLLLVMGLAMFLGGLRFKEQKFQPVLARVNASSLNLAVVALLLPTAVNFTSDGIEEPLMQKFSVAVAIVLILVYVLTLLFSMKTHSYLYEVSVVELEEEGSTDGGGHEKPNSWLWMVVLLVATIGVAFVSEIFVGAVEEATAGLGLTPLFTGVILLPLVGGAAEYVTAVRCALKNNMDLSVSVAMGSSLLVALLVAPLLVIVGQVIGQPMDLNFNLFERAEYARLLRIDTASTANERLLVDFYKLYAQLDDALDITDQDSFDRFIDNARLFGCQPHYFLLDGKVQAVNAPEELAKTLKQSRLVELHSIESQKTALEALLDELGRWTYDDILDDPSLRKLIAKFDPKEDKVNAFFHARAGIFLNS